MHRLSTARTWPSHFSTSSYSTSPPKATRPSSPSTNPAARSSSDRFLPLRSDSIPTRRTGPSPRTFPKSKVWRRRPARLSIPTIFRHDRTSFTQRSCWLPKLTQRSRRLTLRKL
uniref:(northern house mosquito) hypothetical protein n=1 Tax=Culex pipiens TaxID=7175 RepID=A0A8D8HD20_CULPI